MSTIVRQIDRVRALWTPNSEVREQVDKMEPATEMDSILRDCLCAIVERERTVTVVMSNNTGKVNLSRVMLPSGEVQATLWWEPEE